MHKSFWYAAVLAALAYSSIGFAADEQKETQGGSPASKERSTAQEAARGSDPRETPLTELQKQEFTAELQKCESQQGAAKDTCVDNAKKKYGQM
jgi:hypothetical protein